MYANKLASVSKLCYFSLFLGPKKNHKYVVQYLELLHQNETILKYNIDVNAFLSPIFLTGGCVLFLVTVHVISLYWPKAAVCVKNSEMSASSLLLGQTTRSYLFNAILTWAVACASQERSELGELIPITTLQRTRQHRRLLKRNLNFILREVKTRVFFFCINVFEKFFVTSFYWPEIKALDKINVIFVQYRKWSPK